MTTIPLAKGDYKRRVAAEPFIGLRNRFCEANPTLNDSPVSLIARPALKKWQEVGTGPIRKVYSEPGVFDGDLFTVSATEFYRIPAATGTAALVGDLGGDGTGDVSMAATAPVGSEPAHLFFAEGGVLWLYMADGRAIGHLEASAAIANNDVVEIGGTYYKFTNGSVDAGTPAGTVGSPWLVALGSSNADALQNLYDAINGTGTPGTEYSTATTVHDEVTAASVQANDLYVLAIVGGAAGNAVTTTETGANLAWGAATLEDGGEPLLTQVQMPEDVGAISVAHINSYVIVVPIQDEALGTVGRFYWIEPGAITIDALDFATAERAPDKLHQVVVFGDMFWLLGQKTTEPWITTGDLAAPVIRFTGILFDRGSWEGTAVQVKDSLIVVDEDGGVFQIGGGQTRISRPDIEERIRRAMQIEGS